MTWFKREDNQITNDREKTVRTEGLWTQCGSCRQAIFKKDLEENLNVCPNCGHHFRNWWTWNSARRTRWILRT